MTNKAWMKHKDGFWSQIEDPITWPEAWADRDRSHYHAAGYTLTHTFGREENGYQMQVYQRDETPSHFVVFQDSYHGDVFSFYVHDFPTFVELLPGLLAMLRDASLTETNWAETLDTLRLASVERAKQGREIEDEDWRRNQMQSSRPQPKDAPHGTEL